jgi:hypothetical protein
VLERLIVAGVDVVRMNFSHGTAEDHINRATLVRQLSAKHNRPVGILADLQGPKIRVGKFAENKITLKTGDKFILDANCELGNQERVGIDYKELPRDVKSGDMLLLNDGLLVFEVTSVRGSEIHCAVRQGGVLSNNKGINRKGGGLTAPPLTGKDMEDIKIASKLNADFLAVSFPKSGADMYMARELMRAAGGKSIVELTCEGLKPNPAGLRAIAEATDTHIVMGCGFYVDEYQAPSTYGRGVDSYAAEMIAQLTEGAWGTDVRSGIIGEVGCQSPWTDHEKQVMEALKSCGYSFLDGGFEDDGSGREWWSFRPAQG